MPRKPLIIASDAEQVSLLVNTYTFKVQIGWAVSFAAEYLPEALVRKALA